MPDNSERSGGNVEPTSPSGEVVDGLDSVVRHMSVLGCGPCGRTHSSRVEVSRLEVNSSGARRGLLAPNWKDAKQRCQEDTTDSGTHHNREIDVLIL